MATFPAVATLTRKDPRKIVGQDWYPRTSRAARAIPEGGQTGDALGWR